jgi:hypothetical protein
MLQEKPEPILLDQIYGHVASFGVFVNWKVDHFNIRKPTTYVIWILKIHNEKSTTRDIKKWW